MSLCQYVQQLEILMCQKADLVDKLKGWYPAEPESRTILTQVEQDKLITWLVVCARKGDGKNKEQLCLTVHSIIKAEARQTPFKDTKPGYTRTWNRNVMAWHKERLREKPSDGAGRAVCPGNQGKKY